MQYFVTVSTLKMLLDYIISHKHMEEIQMPEHILSKIILVPFISGDISLQSIVLLEPQGKLWILNGQLPIKYVTVLYFFGDIDIYIPIYIHTHYTYFLI